MAPHPAPVGCQDIAGKGPVGIVTHKPKRRYCSPIQRRNTLVGPIATEAGRRSVDAGGPRASEDRLDQLSVARDVHIDATVATRQRPGSAPDVHNAHRAFNSCAVGTCEYNRLDPGVGEPPAHLLHRSPGLHGTLGVITQRRDQREPVGHDCRRNQRHNDLL